jgi:hypothetical protein
VRRQCERIGLLVSFDGEPVVEIECPGYVVELALSVYHQQPEG